MQTLSIRSTRAGFLTAVFAACLSACGGGGSDSAPAATSSAATPAIPTPTSTTATTTPPDAVRLSFTDVQAQILGGRAIQIFAAGLGGSIYSQLLTKTAFQSTATTGSVACSAGGTLTYSRIDADNNSRLSSGDTSSMTASACRLPNLTSSGFNSANGMVSARVGSLFETPYSSTSAWSYNAALTFSNFTGTDSASSRITWDGGVQISDGNSANTSRFDNLTIRNPVTGNTVSVRSGEVRSSPSVASIATAASINYSFRDVVFVTRLAPLGELTVTANQQSNPFVISNTGQYSAGTMLLTVAGARITLTIALPGQIRVEVDNNSDGIIDSTQTVLVNDVVRFSEL